LLAADQSGLFVAYEEERFYRISIAAFQKALELELLEFAQIYLENPSAVWKEANLDKKSRATMVPIPLRFDF
jgi:hypothetical protein